MAEELLANQSQAEETAQAADTTPAQEAQAAADAQVEQAAAGGTEPQMFKLKHNGRTVEMTQPEVIEAAQKGMDYDRIRPGYDAIKELAERHGQNDVGAFVQQLRDNQYQVEKQQRVEEYTAMGIPDDVAARKVEREMQMEERLSSAVTPPTAATEQEAPAITQDQVRKMVSAFPEVAREGKLTLPDEIFEAVANGKTPFEAYSLYKIKQLSEQNRQEQQKDAAMQANAANAAASTGSVTSSPAAEPDISSSEAWDKQTPEFKKKHIQNGDFWKWANKWK